MTDALDTIALGELLIDLVAAESDLPLAETETFVRAPGGAPANVAVGLARLGVRSGFMGKVGDDAFGHYLADVLASEGVDTDQLKLEPAARTALAFVSLQSSGERDFVFYRHPSADMLHRPDEISSSYIRRARAFHFGGLTLAAEPARSATLEAVRIAREAGLVVTFDPNLRLSLWASGEQARAEVLNALASVQVAKLSEEELAFVAGGSGPREARRLLGRGLRLLLVTRGAQGTFYVTPEHEGQVPGFAVAAVDTTGAGDAFMAGFLSRLSADRALLDSREALERAVRFANAAGALATLRRGAIPALPTKREIEGLIEGAA